MELYHLSYRDKLPNNILTPRIPESAVKGYEDTTTKRICFSDSIDNCISALQGDVGVYYVYIPKNIDLVDLYIPSKDQVFDAHVTNEVWALNEVEVICIGYIKNKGIIESIEYEINREPFTFHYRKCDWEWVERYIS